MGRRKILFTKNATEPFKLSRSKIDMYLKCPRCFYIDRKLGVSTPSMPPFNLNLAVDALLKKEFDAYREIDQPHPIMKQAGLNAIPLKSELLSGWQDYHSGLQYEVKSLNMIVYGAPDDVWINEDGEYIVVDYKATSSDKEINLEDAWKIAYKNQVEIYQWLLKKRGYKVSNTAYFVYANALKSPDNFHDKLTFKTILLPYEGDCSWVDAKIEEIYQCLCKDYLPAVGKKCDLCQYVEKVKKL